MRSCPSITVRTVAFVSFAFCCVVMCSLFMRPVRAERLDRWVDQLYMTDLVLEHYVDTGDTR